MGLWDLLCRCCCGRPKEAENGLVGVCGPVDDAEIVAKIFDKCKHFPDGTEVSIGLIVDGKVRTFCGIQREDGRLCWTGASNSSEERVYEIGSITKVFTSTLLARLVVDGKVKDLHGDLSDLLDQEVIIIKDNARIPIESLANHTSGLPRLPTNLKLKQVDKSNPYRNYNEEQLLKYLAHELTLSNKQPRPVAYSNLGAGLLGYALAQSQKKDYEELLQKYIFSEHGMNQSTTVRDNVPLEQLVPGRDQKGNETSHWDLAILAGAGAILSSVQDLSKFLLAYLDSGTSDPSFALTLDDTASVVSPGLCKLLSFLPTTRASRVDIGLGWMILTTKKDGNRWHWHNGGTGGFRSCMAMDVEHKTGVIVLSNLSAFNWQSNRNIDSLCFDLMEVLSTR